MGTRRIEMALNYLFQRSFEVYVLRDRLTDWKRERQTTGKDKEGRNDRRTIVGITLVLYLLEEVREAVGGMEVIVGKEQSTLHLFFHVITSIS